MINKYFIKEKCENIDRFPNWHTKPESFHDCPICHKQGFTKGADVTDYITGLFEEIDKCIDTTNDIRHNHGLNISKQLILKGLIVEKE